MIFCLSNIHTATWTTLAWLVLHKEVNGLMLSTHVYDVLKGKESPAHRQESGTYHQKFDPSMVYHEHVRPDHLFPDQMSRTQMVLATTNPTVIPVRDPLLSLISYQNRAVIHGKTGGEGFLPTGGCIWQNSSTSSVSLPLSSFSVGTSWVPMQNPPCGVLPGTWVSRNVDRQRLGVNWRTTRLEDMTSSFTMLPGTSLP